MGLGPGYRYYQTFEQQLFPLEERIRELLGTHVEHRKLAEEYYSKAEQESDPKKKLAYHRASLREARLYEKQWYTIGRLEERKSQMIARHTRAIERDRLMTERRMARLAAKPLL